MNVRNEDFDTIDPHVRAQLFAENDAKAVRALADETYEQTTQGADAWRDRMAQRHRFGRALDQPPRVVGEFTKELALWAIVMVCFSLTLIFIALAVAS